MIRLTTLCCLGLLTLSLQAAERGLGFIDQLPADSGWRMLDTRPLAQCEKRTVRSARCITTTDLLGHSGRLPSPRDIAWLLGTLGLDGSETVVVAGRPGMARDFVAGLLYLAGQKQVLLLRPPLGRLMGTTAVPLAAGQRRSMSRERHYVARPRDQLIVLRSELQRRLARQETLRLLDVRSQAEYWGEQIRGWRGGHIPGAEFVASLDSQPLRATRAGSGTVIYGHGPLESIAAFARLQAQWDAPVQVLVDGWRAWAADGSLPVDAETYKDNKALIDS